MTFEEAAREQVREETERLAPAVEEAEQRVLMSRFAEGNQTMPMPTQTEPDNSEQLLWIDHSTERTCFSEMHAARNLLNTFRANYNRHYFDSNHGERWNTAYRALYQLERSLRIEREEEKSG